MLNIGTSVMVKSINEEPFIGEIEARSDDSGVMLYRVNDRWFERETLH